MDRRALTVLVVATLAVVALSLSAATLDSTTEPEGSDEENLPGGEGEFGPNQTDERYDGPGIPDLPTSVQRLLTVLFVLGAMGSVVYMVRSPRKTALALLLLAIFAGLLWGFLQLSAGTPDLSSAGDFLPPEQDEGDQTGSSDGQRSLTQTPVLVIVGLLVVVALGVVLLVRRRGDDDEESTDADDEFEPDPEDETAVLGAIAGEAADRIETEGEDSGAENEVYRAWKEMTGELDLSDPETATPREFQNHAVGAGMSPDDVRELTRLFERVRYGGESATEDRERRAVTVLRRIESTYGDAE